MGVRNEGVSGVTCVLARPGMASAEAGTGMVESLVDGPDRSGM